MVIKRRDQSGAISGRILAAIVVILIIGGVIFAVTRNDNSGSNGNASNSSSSTKTATVDGFKFAYPNNWTEVTLNDQDKQAGTLLKLSDPSHNGSFVWYAIKGKLDPSTDLSKTADQIVSRLKANTDQNSAISQKVERLNGRQTIVIQYQQTIDGQIYQVVQRIVPRAKQVDYLTLNVRQDQFKQLSGGLSQLLDSYNQYVTNQEKK